MLICKFCNKEFISNNNGGLVKHENGCIQNPNRILYKNNFNDFNSNRKLGKVQGSNQYIKSKILGLPKPILPIESRKKISEANKSRIYTDEMRKRKSDIMKEVVKKYPESYSSNNVCGRTKSIEYNGIKLNGNWELHTVKWLDSNNINWIRNSKYFEYFWNGKIHKYFPDFYLPEYDIYLEIKGYQRDRDIQKWKAVSNLVIFKKNEINLILKNKFNRAYIRSRS